MKNWILSFLVVGILANPVLAKPPHMGIPAERWLAVAS